MKCNINIVIYNYTFNKQFKKNGKKKKYYVKRYNARSNNMYPSLIRIPPPEITLAEITQ